MTNDEYLAAMRAMDLASLSALTMMEGHNLAAFIERSRRADEAGPYLDARLWTEGRALNDAWRELAAAMALFLQTARRVRARLPQAGESHSEAIARSAAGGSDV